MEDIMVWVGVVVGGLLALREVAMQIVKRTATPKDDVWVGKAYKVIEMVAGVLNKDVKQKIAMEAPKD